MKIIRKTSYVLFIITLILALSSCTKKKDMVEKNGFYFDTVVKITLFNAEEKYLDECFKLCEKYENLLSASIETSEISLINKNSQEGIYTVVSDETLSLIKSGISYGEISNGKFDITIGRLSGLWNFSSDSPCVPNELDIKKNIEHVNYKCISIKGNSVLLTDKESSLDLGGIAKGFIADKLKEYLLENGITKGIINLGGNVLLIGSKPDNSNYNIGVQTPFASENDVAAIVNAKDKSIVTSGVYERYYYENDILYHHILDTETGYPVENDLLGVTIISDDSIDGDGLSTTVFALGLNKGIKLIETIKNTEAIFIDKDYNIHITSGLNIDESNKVSVN